MIGAQALAGALFLTPSPILGQARPPAAPAKDVKITWTMPRMADGHPDLNGIWQALVTANWDLQDHEAQPGPHPEINAAYGAGPAGQSVIDGGGEIPYRPEALAKKKQNFQNRAVADVSSDKTWHNLGDPEFKCYMPGVPRANYMPFRFALCMGQAPTS
jgi:hypothetical protein